VNLLEDPQPTQLRLPVPPEVPALLHALVRMVALAVHLPPAVMLMLKQKVSAHRAFTARKGIWGQ
jgi:hypothetical protein